MNSIFWEITIILMLLVLNGVFAMTEIAVISSRKGRLKLLADQGDRRAKTALELADSPNRFLSTVQIGITLVGIMAGAFGGATIAESLASGLEQFPMIAPYRQAIGVGVVVVFITYFSLILGELVPKRLGLNNPERVSLLMARPMHWLSIMANPVVKFLGFSTDALLKLFRVSPSKEGGVSEEEVKILMQEGLRAGAFNKVESAIVESALELDRLPVSEIMTPRPKIIWINQNDPHEAIWHKIVVSGHSSFPVYEDQRDNPVGIVTVKSIYANMAAGIPIRVKDLMTKPLVVPTSQTVIQLLDTFKQTGKHMALIADEFGSMRGLVTLHDVMEAVIGDLPSQDERARPSALKREDGSWLIDAMIDVDSLQGIFPKINFGKEQSRGYQTLAGFVVKQLGHLPKEGETFEAGGYIFEILDMDRHRVDKLLVMPVPLNHPAKQNTDQFQI